MIISWPNVGGVVLLLLLHTLAIAQGQQASVDEKNTALPTHIIDATSGAEPDLAKLSAELRQAPNFSSTLAITSPGNAEIASFQDAERFKQAVVQLVMEEKEKEKIIIGPSLTGDTTSLKLSQAFTDAKVPDCLHKDGLKRQPPRIGFFVFKGVLALPFVALAAARGKCN